VPAPLHRWSVAAVLAVAVAGLIGCGAGVNVRLGPGSGDLPIPRLEVDLDGQRDAERERRRQVLLHRHTARERAVREVLAGRLTLGQAAARVRAVERELPVTWGPPRTEGGPGDDERLCRYVMAWAHIWVAENLPAAADPVARRLEAELQQLRGPDGVVRLPEG
jgi:hypothetical protein